MKNKVTSNMFFIVGVSTKYKLSLSKNKRGKKKKKNEGFNWYTQISEHLKYLKTLF